MLKSLLLQVVNAAHCWMPLHLSLQAQVPETERVSTLPQRRLLCCPSVVRTNQAASCIEETMDTMELK